MPFKNLFLKIELNTCFCLEYIQPYKEKIKGQEILNDDLSLG